MVSKEHQRLVNLLARELEKHQGIKITAIDISGTPEHFEERYKSLPPPSGYNGSIPDLEGTDASGTYHLGEAKTDMNAENLDDQLKRFSNLKMKKTNTPVPLHIVVPESIRSQMKSRIRNIGLGDKLVNRRISVWY